MNNWRSDEYDANRANDDQADEVNFHPYQEIDRDANEANQFFWAYPTGLGF